MYISGKTGQGYYVQMTTGFCVHVYSSLSTSTLAVDNLGLFLWTCRVLAHVAFSAMGKCTRYNLQSRAYSGSGGLTHRGGTWFHLTLEKFIWNNQKYYKKATKFIFLIKIFPLYKRIKKEELHKLIASIATANCYKPPWKGNTIYLYTYIPTIGMDIYVSWSWILNKQTSHPGYSLSSNPKRRVSDWP